MNSETSATELAQANRQTKVFRVELKYAMVEGVRQHGPDAVGMLIVGLARLTMAVATLGALWLASSLLGLNTTAYSVIGMSGLSAAMGCLIARHDRFK